MTDPNIEDLTRRVSRIEAALAKPILPEDPEPPEPLPRPVLPEGFRVQGRARLVALTWSTPLPPETPGVQVFRKPAFKPDGEGWESLTKIAVDMWRDEISESDASVESRWIYKVRGYGYNEIGVPFASPWSEELEYTIDPPQPPDPPDPPEPGEFNALECIGNDSIDNKLVRLPALRQSRGPRDDVGALGDIRAGDWQKGEDLVWSDKSSVVPKGYNQWSSNLHKGTLERRGGSYEWRNIGVAPGLDASQLKWGTREYNAPERLFVACDFTEIPQEHGLYVSNSGSTVLEGCTFLRVGSQGAQWAYRPEPYQQYGADNMPYAEEPEHTVIDSHFVDCGQGGTRPSFSLTYFSPGTSAFPGTLRIENSSFVADWNVPRSGDGCRSTGALVVTPSQGNVPLEGQNMMRSVWVKNSLFDYTKGDRSIASIRSVDEVVFEDCAFIARDHSQPNITIDKDYGSLNGTKTKVIRFLNCRSEGVRLKVLLAPDSAGKQVAVMHDIDCPGGEIAINGRTGLPL